MSIGNAKQALAIAVLLATVLAAGCGGGEDASERAVEWRVDRQLGPKRVLLAADVEWCSAKLPEAEEPIVEYEGDRAYIELRVTPEEKKEGQNGCLLQLLGVHKAVTLERDLTELILFDSSTDPPERRWPK